MIKISVPLDALCHTRSTPMEMGQILERLVMAHRYLYYVKNKPVISDFDYDKLESNAILILDKSGVKDSPLLKPGSDLDSDYPEEVKDLAAKLK